MQLDRNALNKMLSLNDRQLQLLIQKLTSEYGLDLSKFQVREGDIASLRRAIQHASDEELLALTKQLKK